MLDTLHAQVAVWLTRWTPGLVNHLWRATVFAALVVALVRLARPSRRSRQLLYGLAFIALWIPAPLVDGVVHALWPAVSERVVLRFPSSRAWAVLDRAVAPVPQARPTWVALERGHARAAHDERLCLALLVWLLGCICSLVAWRRQLRSGRVANARAAPESIALARLRVHFGVRRQVHVVISEQCHAPAVHGHRRPVILVPSDLRRQMSSAELEALLAHELAHVVRADNLRSSLARVACSLLWFHPFIWWLAVRLGEERELACDQRALAVTRDPESYVAALERTVRLCILRPIAGTAAAGGTDVARRLELLLAPADPGERALWRRLILPTVVAGCVAWLVIVPVEGHAGLGWHAPHGRMFDQDMRGIGPSEELPDQTVATLERAVASVPDDLDSRGALLRHYWTLIVHARASETVRAAHERHALWVVEHEPASGAARFLVATSVPWMTSQAQARIRASWLEALAASPARADLLESAAASMRWIDRPLERRLLEQGLALEPSEPYWHLRLGSSYLRQASRAKPKGTPGAREIARLALAELESARALLPDSATRTDLLLDLARAARLADDADTARRHATALLALSTPDDLNYGRAVHEGNIILGELALASGDSIEAQRRLGLAGQTPGDPGLDTIGPDLELAAQLLTRGDSHAVIQYLKACARFWTRARPQLDEAIRQIESGGVPALDRRSLAGG